MPPDIQSALNHAIALQQHGRLADAEAVTRQILATHQDASAFHLLGVLCAQQGRRQEGLDFVNAALRLNPADAMALNNRASILHGLKRFDEAVTSYDQALTLVHRRDPVMWTNRGMSLRDGGRLWDALKSCDAALTLQPGHVKALVLRGTVLHALDRSAEAWGMLEQALAAAPHDRDALLNGAMVLTGLKRFDEALALSDIVLDARPGDADAMIRRAHVLLAMGRAADAVETYDLALALVPRHSEALTSRGLALLECGRLDDAIASFDAAIRADASNADANWNMGLCLLLKGNFAKGLALYGWRTRLARPVERRDFPQPLWTGMDEIAGKTIFLHATEQGLGDTIQFFRFASQLRARGAHVILAVQDALTRLLRDAGTDIDIVSARQAPPMFDCHSPLLSLPAALRMRLGTIPASVPYLRAQSECVKDWGAKIGAHGFRVGIHWQGARRDIDRGRSFPLTLFQRIAAIPGVRLISLQKNDGAEQVHDLPPGMTVEVLEQVDDGPDAFLDTAAILENLDLVITSDTALAHLAGALARPTWVALKFLPDWRWLLERGDSPWYPTLRLFRQTVNGDWSHPFELMETELKALTSHPVQTSA
jgi:tetratricopeptide (TPR) repeat protein